MSRQDQEPRSGSPEIARARDFIGKRVIIKKIENGEVFDQGVVESVDDDGTVYVNCDGGSLLGVNLRYHTVTVSAN